MLNLTELEQRALDAPINLADGHARQDPTPAQAEIISRLPELFADAQREPFEEIEHRAQAAFLACLGQASAPVQAGRIVSTYSSSVATMVVGKYLQRRGHRVALIHPTFDSIPDLLHEHVQQIPISERSLEEEDWERVERQGATCVFLTTPNNPTGWRLEEDTLVRMVEWAGKRGVLLCFDTSFRGFDVRAQFDMYRILEDAGVDYIVIEDTGKLWPMSELKLGFIAMSADLKQSIKRIMSDVLLSVSPLVIRLIEELAINDANGGADELHSLIATNRNLIREAAADLDGVALPDPDARVSVCRLRFPSGEEGLRVRLGLEKRGVHVLPCAQFYWAEPTAGAAELRVALARNPEILNEALERLRELCLGARRTHARRPVGRR